MPYSEGVLFDVIRTNVAGPLSHSSSAPIHARAKHVAVTGSSSYIGSKGLLDAIVPTLALEVAPFDLRVCNLSFGFFRTELMSENNATHAATKQIPELAELHKVIDDSLEAGAVVDPKKGCELVAEALEAREDVLARNYHCAFRLGLGLLVS
ncbi:hypothetical protein N7478_004768 [Penicillium angulare]|uniref:uncharacterized protein n=1 Tax=Penicillium angulare TaxID=116970 RepID=UPI0025413069|nr:uncharacterized protein N7478_004768 [Penicillium angulare]KAJ5279396.1 hypothetical protein N7478_004768 [Penicillium angulare]